MPHRIPTSIRLPRRCEAQDNVGSPVDGGCYMPGRSWDVAAQSARLIVCAGVDGRDPDGRVGNAGRGVVYVRESFLPRTGDRWQDTHRGYLGVVELSSEQIAAAGLLSGRRGRQKAEQAANRILAAWHDLCAPLIGTTRRVPDRIDVQLTGYDPNTGKPNPRPAIPAGVAPTPDWRDVELAAEHLFVRGDEHDFAIWVRVPIDEHGWHHNGAEPADDWPADEAWAEWEACQFSTGQVWPLALIRRLADQPDLAVVR